MKRFEIGENLSLTLVILGICAVIIIGIIFL
jgi:hypothetical protein